MVAAGMTPSREARGEPVAGLPSLETPRLERRGADAHLAGRQVPSPRAERVRTRVVRLDGASLEGSARAVRRARVAEREVAVVTDRDPPTIPGHVLVHLELDLDASVLGRELQLPVALSRTRAAPHDVVLPGQRR